VKLKAYGFSNYVLSWIANLLYDRKQFVKIDCHVSKCVSVPSGVIQGSVIGPLLFVLYINDLPEIILHSSVLLYADDLKLCRAIKSAIDRVLMQVDINAIFHWSCIWFLPLCLSKLFCLHLGHRLNDHVYLCDAFPITVVSQIKDLGVLFSTSMNFRDHFSYICKKSLCSVWYDI